MDDANDSGDGDDDSEQKYSSVSVHLHLQNDRVAIGNKDSDVVQVAIMFPIVYLFCRGAEENDERAVFYNHLHHRVCLSPSAYRQFGFYQH